MNRQEKINKIVNDFLGREYGELISHSEIEGIIGEKRESSAYRSVMTVAKKRLVESGKMVENVFGVGYRVVVPDEYTGHSVKTVISGAKRIDQGVKILRHAPVKDMSMEGVQVYNLVNDRVSILQAKMAGAKVEISMLGRKREHPLKIMENR